MLVQRLDHSCVTLFSFGSYHEVRCVHLELSRMALPSRRKVARAGESKVSHCCDASPFEGAACVRNYGKRALDQKGLPPCEMG